MIDIDESTKKILLFLAVAFCLFFVILISVNLYFSNQDNEVLDGPIIVGEVEEVLEESVKDDVEEELIQEEGSKTIIVKDTKPDFIQKGSIRINLERVYVKEGNKDDYDIYYEISGQDLILDEIESKASGNFFYRSPFSWSGYLLFHANEINNLLVCDSESNGRFWTTTFCINVDELGKGYFGQTTRLVYTDQSFADLEELSLGAMTKKDRTYVFEVVLPKEFYDKSS